MRTQLGFVSAVFVTVTFVMDFVTAVTNTQIVSRNMSPINVFRTTTLNVNYGRFVYLTPNKYTTAKVGLHCVVTVLKNDPFSSQIGSILPSQFPCNFQSKSILYQHYGSLTKMTDVVKLRVQVDTKNETLVSSFTIRVKVLFDKPMSALKKLDTLMVDELGGLSNPIESNIVSIKFNEENELCTVCFLPKRNGPPFFGGIVNTTDDVRGLDTSPNTDLMYVPCNKFVSGVLRYAHKRTRRSSKTDFLPLLVEISDKTSSKIKSREYVQLPVRIRRASVNSPPMIDYNSASYSLQVDQMVHTALTTSVIKAVDKETDAAAIIFNVTIPPKRNEGYLVHTDDPMQPITTFYQKDLEDLKIAFKPPEVLSTAQRLQQIWMEARDSEGASSGSFYVIIVIKPMNTNAPQVIKNSGLAMYEGQSRLLDKNSLYIRDPDNEDDVTVAVIGGLFHGKLEKDRREVIDFSLSDINNGKIRYIHDDSNSYHDNMMLRISDGESQVNALFSVTIIPKDDEPPNLVYNTGVTVDEGGFVKIDQFDLSARDIDSDDTNIYFEVVDPPKYGFLFRRLSNFIVTTSDFHQSVEKRIEKFSQIDIILGDIFYKHSGLEVFNDQFTFRLSDGAKPPNLSGLKTFIIDARPVDDMAPEIHPDCPLKLLVLEGEKKAFTKQALQYIDRDSPDNELTYSITREPFFFDPPSIAKAGKITLAHDHTTPIFKFTQKQINHLKVIYHSPLSEVGINRRIVKFLFNVTDPNGNYLDLQEFKIELLPVNNKAPIAYTSALTVKEAQKGIVSSMNLQPFDNDNPRGDLHFIVKKQARHGSLLLNGEKAALGVSITLSDISSRKVEYFHDGSETRSDEIKFVLSDGLHDVPVVLPIIITPSDDEAPMVTMLKTSLQLQENGMVQLDGDVMQATDADSVDDKLTFVVAEPLKYGSLMKEGSKVIVFTVADLNKGIIKYQHTQGEIGNAPQQDLLKLTLTDLSDDIVVGGNLYSGIVIKINIEPVDSEQPTASGNFTLLVHEGNRTQILEDTLSIADPDTDLVNVICNITTPPTYGYIETSGTSFGSESNRLGMSLAVFSAYDLNHGFISYVQSLHEGVEPDSDQFLIKCSDGNNTASPVTIDVIIAPTNDEKPIIFVQPNLMCIEDDLLLFDLSKINLYDADKPNDVIAVTVLKQPTNGELLLQKKTELVRATIFTKDDLYHDGAATLMYQHKGTETTSDSFKILVSDGVHKVRETIKITIVSMDDEKPRLTVNTGLRLDRGETKVITAYNLRASDLDSIDETLMYIVMMKPASGKLQKVISPMMTVDIGKGGNFTQFDVNARKIRYTHIEGSKDNRDVIRLDVTDGFNRLINQMFTVMITPVDNILPIIVVNHGVTLNENSRVTLTTDMLSASDLNTPDEDLSFVITKTPVKGFLQHLDNQGVPITKFSQLDLAANKISYQHTSPDETKVDNFEFEVTDGRNKIFRTFRLKINDVNNKKPYVYMTEIRARQGEETVITPFELTAVDNDTNSNELQFKISSFPKYGTLLNDKNKRIIIFTQNDLNMNKIRYKHDGSKIRTDGFSFTVSDGVHDEFFASPDISKATRRPVYIDIVIATVDKSAPVLVRNKGATSLRARKTSTLFKFTPSKLKAVDANSDDKDVKFSIKVQPKHGRLVKLSNKEFSLNKFSQQDINDKNVAYVLNSGSVASSDGFLFDVYDEKKNILTDQTFSLRWARVSVEKLVYHANETNRAAKISLTRTGFLGETSFVTYSVIDGSGKKGKHFDVVPRRQVRFNPDETSVLIEIPIIDNTIYEKQKIFRVILKKGYNTLITRRNNCTVVISDNEDEPKIAMVLRSVKVHESVGTLQIPIRRSGDISEGVRAMCTTQSDTAKGTVDGSVTSYHDYITRDEADRSKSIMFFANESLKYCEIRIIDDSMYEGAEQFEVQLWPLYGGKVKNAFSKTKVTILEDAKDEPLISFRHSSYNVDESDEYVTVGVNRDGSDLSVTSYVLLATREHVPISAEANKDYHPLVQPLIFEPGVATLNVRIDILDDQGAVRQEGEETFDVILVTPRNAKLSGIVKANVTIDDSISDEPRVFFTQSEYTVKEDIGTLSVAVERDGDLRHDTRVRCYTRQLSAMAKKDFIERTNSENSMIQFRRGERKKICQVEIVDDTIFEKEEDFKVVLGHVNSGLIVGKKNTTLVKIKHNDQPVIEFAQKRFFVKEPTFDKKEGEGEIIVRRKGDASHKSSVMIHTKDGSANGKKNFLPIAQRLDFNINETEVIFKIKIFYDPAQTLRSIFSVHLTDDDESDVELGLHKTLVVIEEARKRAAATFPLAPVVVSLVDYDDVAKAKMPVHGYPLVCVTACNERHPQYKETKAFCASESINNNMTSYRWQVAVPSYSDGTSNRFKDINLKLFFASPYQITLDSVYFNAGSRVRCIAQPASIDGDFGVESTSNEVIIDLVEGICPPKRIADVGAETYSVKVAYTGVKEGSFKNLVKITVLIPHIDGLLPVISSKRLSNFDLTLSPDVSRSAQHTCSNILNPSEIRTRYSFNDHRSDDKSVTEIYPYQFDGTIRGNATARFYRNLNLESCLWTFESYFNMSELITTCGAKTITDGLIKNAVQSHLTVDMPLFVSYIYRSSNDEDGWTDFNHQSSVRLTAVYNTGMLWKDGVGLPEKAKLKGNLYPASISVRKTDRKLQLNFRTKARFRGMFILASRGAAQKSEVMLLERPGLLFHLKLIRSEPTFDEPEQLWQVESKFAVGDYSGSYMFKMVPCTVDQSASFSLPPDCTPREAVSFHLNLTIQQTSEPVEATFTLNTRFLLLNNPEYWQSPTLKTSQVTDVYFKEGQPIYGRVMIDNSQSLGDAYHIMVEKVFLCSGFDGYIPMFDPGNKKYGCIADSADLMHRFKILDRLNPETEKKTFSNVAFNAQLAMNDKNATDLVKLAASDGFRIDSSPLFKVSSGRTWFLHVIYTLRSQEEKRRRLGKRSIERHLVSAFPSSRVKRDAPPRTETTRDIRSISDGNQGTNLQVILLEGKNIEKSEKTTMHDDENARSGGKERNTALISVIVVLLIILFVGLLIGFKLYVRAQNATMLVAGAGNQGTEI